MKNSKEHHSEAQGPTVHNLTARPLRVASPVLNREPRPKGPDDLLTLDEAAARLGVSDKTLRALVRDGSLRYITIGQGKQRPTYRFAPADLADFIKKQTQQETAPCPSTKTSARRSTPTSSGSKVIAIADRLRNGTSAKRKP